jgi:hypothetical protein
MHPRLFKTGWLLGTASVLMAGCWVPGVFDCPALVSPMWLSTELDGPIGIGPPLISANCEGRATDGAVLGMLRRPSRCSFTEGTVLTVSSEPIALAGLFGSDFLVASDTSLQWLDGAESSSTDRVPPGRMVFSERLNARVAFVVSAGGDAHLVSPEAIFDLAVPLPGVQRAGLVGGESAGATWILDTAGSWLVRRVDGFGLTSGAAVESGSALVRGSLLPVVVQPSASALLLGEPGKSRRMSLVGWTPTRIVSAAQTGSTRSVLIELAPEESSRLSQLEMPANHVYGWVSVPEADVTDLSVSVLLFSRSEIQESAWAGEDTHARLVLAVDGQLVTASAEAGICVLRTSPDIHWNRVAGSPGGAILASGKRGQQPIVMRFGPAEFDN